MTNSYSPIKYSWFPARHNSGRGPPEPSALLFSKRAVHPGPTPRPLRPPPPRRRCAAATTTPAAPRARAAGAASASLASRAGSHVPSSHDCCRSRCASVDVLAGIACAPAGWGCAGTFASSALSATGASGLFRSPRCCSPGVWRPRSSPRICAYGFVAFRRGACRVLGLILRRSHILWRCHEGMPCMACVWYFWVPVLLWVPGYFLGASGPQTSFRMAPPRERGAGDASSEHC